MESDRHQSGLGFDLLVFTFSRCMKVNLVPSIVRSRVIDVYISASRSDLYETRLSIQERWHHAGLLFKRRCKVTETSFGFCPRHKAYDSANTGVCDREAFALIGTRGNSQVSF